MKAMHFFFFSNTLEKSLEMRWSNNKVALSDKCFVHLGEDIPETLFLLLHQWFIGKFLIKIT